MREVSCRNEPSGAYTVLHAVPSINTRALYANALNSIAKRESRGSKTLWQVQGSALLGLGAKPLVSLLRNPSSCAMIHL